MSGHTVVEKRSRFVAVAARVASLEEAEAFVAGRRRALRKARHHCWACRVPGGHRPLEQARDDGEVGRPGHALLDLLRHREHLGIVLVVSRLYGGVKLGPAGVTRAVRRAAEGALGDLDPS